MWFCMIVRVVNSYVQAQLKLPHTVSAWCILVLLSEAVKPKGNVGVFIMCVGVYGMKDMKTALIWCFLLMYL